MEISPDLFSDVISNDKSLCYAYEPEMKQQSSKWKSRNSPHPKKSVVSEVQFQDNADCFLPSSTKVIVHSEFFCND